ncbi:hypothetical protein MNBD_GAMMA08-1106 [hydrothermal vent metagenome]|uniref:Uncharacterized protein n=1 Tax=hydrothermal vent metagenome TaxID=652676 RepID=A0A3B0XF42_9ZZZZ
MKYLVFISLFYTSIISAETNNIELLNEWKSRGFSQVRINFPSDNFQVVQAVITDDTEGKQVLEFRYFTKKGKECTSRNINKSSDVVVKINSTRVKMKAGCKSAMFSKYIGYYATTKKGREYIKNEFTVTAKVLVELQGLKLNFPTQGFTTAWNKYGGDAI